MRHHTYTITQSKIIAKGWSTHLLLTVEAKADDGSTQILNREVHDHGHGAAILPIDPERGTCLLVRQWRAAAAFSGHKGELLESCAGLLEGDDPETCVKREAMEELGVAVHDVRHVANCFSSPGAVTERLSLFTATYAPDDRINAGGGLAIEHEDIEVVEMSLFEAYGLIATGAIEDAKTIILLQHALLSPVITKF